MLTTLFVIVLTVGAYALSLQIRKRYVSPFTTPVLLSTAVVIAVLVVLRVDLTAYAPGKTIMTFLLGPATVALALPLYKNRAVFLRHISPALAGIVIGSIATMLVALTIAQLFGLSHVLVASLGIKSTTAAVAVDLAQIIHGDPALTAIFVVCTGIIGASFGPAILDRAGVRSPIARGISLGTISHGQGTAQAASENELSGAVAGVAMGLGAVFTSLAAPIVVPLFAR
ncbi:MAG: LrgB family protein [Candidatus Velthaea sp.]